MVAQCLQFIGIIDSCDFRSSSYTYILSHGDLYQNKHKITGDVEGCRTRFSYRSETTNTSHTNGQDVNRDSNHILRILTSGFNDDWIECIPNWNSKYVQLSTSRAIIGIVSNIERSKSVHFVLFQQYCQTTGCSNFWYTSSTIGTRCCEIESKSGECVTKYSYINISINFYR